MSDTDDIWRTIRGLTDRLGKIESWMSAQSDNHAALATAVAALEDAIGTPDVDDSPLMEVVDRLWSDVRRVEGAIGELAKQFADQHAALGKFLRDLLGDDRERGQAEAAKPITPDRVAQATGEDLDLIAERLGLLRLGSMWTHQGPRETDDAIRIRCAVALFAQAFDRGLAVRIAADAKTAAGQDDGRGIPSWVVDAVMAAAGAHPSIGRPQCVEEPMADRHGSGRVAARELEHALGYAPGSLSWPVMLERVRETIVQRNDARGKVTECTAELDRYEHRIETLEASRARIAQVLDVKDDVHVIEAAVSRIVRDLGPAIARAAEEHAELERARRLITAVADWYREAKASTRTIPADIAMALMGPDREFFAYEWPLAQAYDAWVPAQASMPASEHEAIAADSPPMAWFACY